LTQKPPFSCSFNQGAGWEQASRRTSFDVADTYKTFPKQLSFVTSPIFLSTSTVLYRGICIYVFVLAVEDVHAIFHEVEGPSRKKPNINYKIQQIAIINALQLQ